MSEDNELKQEEMEQTQLDSLEFDKDEKEYDSKGPEIKEPYDPDKVDIIPNTMTIRLLLDRIEHDEIDLNPDFQRKSGLWDETKKSRLI